MQFRRCQRIRANAEFDSLFANGKRINCGPFVLIITPGTQSYSRLGVIASKKVGNAIARNRAKRLLRETFRTCAPNLTQPLNILIIARYSIFNYPLVELKERFIKGIGQYNTK